MLHTIKNEHLTVTVAECGAELQSILSRDGTEYLWQGDPAYWKGRSPNLFPFVARLTGGCYQLDGKTYEMRIHGFAPVSNFTLVESTEDTLVMELTDSEETLAQFPRHFSFRIRYVLKDNRLEVNYEVENRDQRTMYFGMGGHPSFRVPLTEGKRFEDYYLRFSEPCEPVRIGFSPDCFVNGVVTPYALEDGTKLPLRHDLFDADAVVLKNAPRQVTLETADDPRSVTVTYPQMPYIGFWHKPKSDAPYVCIEPWLSLPASLGKTTVLEEHPDLVALAPNKLWTAQMIIEIH